ncbi:MAG TPA: hypothetical protein VN620_09420, partial [Candidatus Methylomirabilis sp.]|nr:hypothetical protein [Candidatus Methylomirabilis sp.]
PIAAAKNTARKPSERLVRFTGNLPLSRGENARGVPNVPVEFLGFSRPTASRTRYRRNFLVQTLTAAD